MKLEICDLRRRAAAPWTRLACRFFWRAGLILGLALAPANSSAADAPKNPAVNENFYSVQSVGDHVWIVGYYGTILHSSDRGSTWESQTSSTRNALFNVRFADPARGWIGGSHGTLLHSVDAGKNWRVQSSGTTQHLFGSFWLDPTHGWMVGSRGAVLRTVDGGSSWLSATVAGDFTFSGIAFVNRTDGWISGEFGVIFQTRDGGNTWHKQKSPVEVSFSSGESRNLFALVFTTPKMGYAFGLDGVVLKTRDGISWAIARQRTDTDSPAGSHHLFAAAAFSDGLWAVGERGAFLQSDLDAMSWRPVHSAAPRLSLNAIAFGNDGRGFVVGNRGLVLSSEDRGATWKRVTLNFRRLAKDAVRTP